MVLKATGLQKHNLLCGMQAGKKFWHVPVTEYNYCIIIYRSLRQVIIAYKDKRVFTWKSSVKRNTTSPVYNESFSYEVATEMRMVVDIEDVMVSFYVIDCDSMGVVTIGKNASSELGRQHWNEILQSPELLISLWHPIQTATASQRRHIRNKSSS